MLKTQILHRRKANSSELSKRLSELADLFVMDTFATSHRAHASTTGVTFSKEACAGLLLDEELNALSKLKMKLKFSRCIGVPRYQQNSI